MGYDADRAISKAQEVIRKYNTRNPWKLAEMLPNVAIVHTDLGDNIQGYTIRSRQFSIITLNDGSPDYGKPGTPLHEIGHAILTPGTGTNYFYKNCPPAAIGSDEYIANCFMFQMLFGDRGQISPMNRNKILEQYGLPCWMGQYFDLIN